MEREPADEGQDEEPIPGTTRRANVEPPPTVQMLSPPLTWSNKRPIQAQSLDRQRHAVTHRGTVIHLTGLILTPDFCVGEPST